MATHTLSRTSAAQGALAFAKTTLVGGIVFLVPLLVLILLVSKAIALLERLSQPVASRLPVGPVLGVVAGDVIAIAIIVLACFGAGLLARVSFAARFVKKAEAGVLWRVPGYGFIKGLTDSFDQSAAASCMRPVLANFGNYSQLAFEVDELADGRKVVYVPSAPDPRGGMVFVLAREQVEPMPATFIGAVRTLRELGRGMSACFVPKNTARPSPERHAAAPSAAPPS